MRSGQTSCPGRRAGPQIRARVARDIWLTRMGSDQDPIRAGQLVHHVSALTRAKVPRDIWSTPWARGHERELPLSSGRSLGQSDLSAICPGELVQTVGPRNHARVTWERW